MSFGGSSRAGLTFSLKVSLLYAALFVVGALGLFGIAFLFIESLVEQREQEVIQAQLQEYRAWYEEGGLPALKARLGQESKNRREIFFFRVSSRLNNVVFVSIPEGSEAFNPKQLQTISPTASGFWNSFNSQGEKSAWVIASTRLRGGYFLQVGKNVAQRQEILSYFRSLFLYFTIPVLLTGVLIGGAITFRAMLPIRRLIQTVRHILETGETSQRVPSRSERGELDELVILFNQMLDKHEALIRAMHDSLDNVAHDLRTPMTRIRGIAELSLQSPNDHERCLEALSDAMEESERVLTMLNTLMDISEAETGSMHLSIATLSVKEMVQTAIDLFEILAEEKGIALQSHVSGNPIVQADRVRLQQVVANLLDNAFKYTRPGGNITISAVEKEDFLKITVADNGIGIGPEDLDKIWDRLYRGDSSRSKRGLGLGLSFVKAIVEAHGGSVAVESRVNEGSIFTVWLPAV